jgi:hypothetical protein
MRRLQYLFDDLEFMFTNTRIRLIQSNGHRASFYGDIQELKRMIKIIHWLHLTSYYDRWYALVTFSDDSCAYIRCSYENFWSHDNKLRFYMGTSHTELIQHAMKDHAYKSFRKRVSAASAVSASS